MQTHTLYGNANYQVIAFQLHEFDIFHRDLRGGEWIQGFAYLLVVSRSKDARPHAAFTVWHKLYEAYINTVIK